MQRGARQSGDPRPSRGAGPPRELLEAVSDTSAREVVGGDLNLDAVARVYPDVIAPHATCQLGKHHVAAVQFDAEKRVGEGLSDLSLKLNRLFLLG